MTTLETKRKQLQEERFATYQKYAQTINDFEAYKKSNPQNLEATTNIFDLEIETLQAKLASLQEEIDNLK